ncbi:MAG: hypothetical protein C4318_09065 [Acidimicrobiia bacterium]
MKTGITLPVFDVAVSDAVDAAVDAERLGLDGVFVFDHLAPPGLSGNSAALECFSLLGAVGVATKKVEIGALVAKAWLRPPAVTAQAFSTLNVISKGRVVAGLGISDKLSAREVAAYFLDFPPRAERVRALERSVDEIKAAGIKAIWIGGSSATLLHIAAKHGLCVNLWNVPPGRVLEVRRVLAKLSGQPESSLSLQVSWGADLSLVEKDNGILEKVARNGASYLIVGVPRRDLLKRAAKKLDTARRILGQ